MSPDLALIGGSTMSALRRLVGVKRKCCERHQYDAPDPKRTSDRVVNDRDDCDGAGTLADNNGSGFSSPEPFSLLFIAEHVAFAMAGNYANLLQTRMAASVGLGPPVAITLD